MSSNTLKHSVLFYSSFFLILVCEIFVFEYKLIPLITIPLIFLALHLKYFSKNFIKEILFIAVAFFIGFSLEAVMSILDVYHLGIIDLNGFTWPKPWVTAAWLLIPIYLVHSARALNSYPVPGAYAGAILAYCFYSFIGESFDLIFFHRPKIQSALFFILAWYLLIRGFFRLYKKITDQPS